MSLKNEDAWAKTAIAFGILVGVPLLAIAVLLAIVE
jgi:hypothetical protein